MQDEDTNEDDDDIMNLVKPKFVKTTSTQGNET